MSTISYGGTLTAGIQDISALLPLLGTEQCEDHAGSGLSDGFLFAAATPLSIFGTLGLARAGFKALFASIIIPRWSFIGAEKLRDAGFKPSGKNLGLIMMDPANPDRHLVETQLAARLKDLHLENDGGVPVSFDWKGLHRWNLKMALFTAAFSTANLVAYIELISNNRNRLPLSLRIIFPISRSLGSFLTVISLQFLIQRRIANIVDARDVFWRLDHFVRREHSFLRELIGPEELAKLEWGPNISSEKCICRLRSHTSSPMFDFWRSVDNGAKFKLRMSIQEYTDPNSSRVRDLAFILLMLFGIFGCVVGYIGCFSIVQGYPGDSLRGPLIWLSAEVALSFVRMLIWSSNPTWDDAPPIDLAIHLPSSRQPFVTHEKPGNGAEDVDDGSIALQRAHEFFDSLQRHSGVFIRPLDFPGCSLLYSVTRNEEGAPVLYIAIVDHVDQTTRVYSEEDDMPSFKTATLSMAPQLHATLGEPITSESHDHIASSSSLRFALQDHYRSVFRMSSRNLLSQENEHVGLNWELAQMFGRMRAEEA